MRRIFLPGWVQRHTPWFEPESRTQAEWDALRRQLAVFHPAHPQVSVVIPTYNDAHQMMGALSSLAHCGLGSVIPTELIVIDDGSSDATADWLPRAGVTTERFGQNQGRKFARQRGLEMARGRVLLQADADTLYPPGWGLAFIRALDRPEVAVVYGSHAFMPQPGLTRPALYVHELLGDAARWIKRRRPELTHINVHGFNSGFRRLDGLDKGSYDFPPGQSEDGYMAELLKRYGKLWYVSGAANTVYTSPRRLLADGGLLKSATKRMKRELNRLHERKPGA